MQFHEVYIQCMKEHKIKLSVRKMIQMGKGEEGNKFKKTIVFSSLGTTEYFRNSYYVIVKWSANKEKIL